MFLAVIVMSWLLIGLLKSTVEIPDGNKNQEKAKSYIQAPIWWSNGISIQDKVFGLVYLFAGANMIEKRYSEV